MGEQRPMFRFRLPWMMAAPAPPPVATPSPPRAEAPSTASQPQIRSEPTVNPTTPARRPFRLSGMAPAATPPPIQPIVESQSRSEPITITSTPKTLPASPIWSPKVSTRQDPRPLAEVPPETKSLSENSFQAASPPPPSPQLSVVSRPPSPRQLPSQLPSPKSSPQPSPPGPISSKPRDASRPSSPVEAQSQKSLQAETPQQPHSPPRFQSSGRKSSVTSPSLRATNVQQTNGTAPKSPPRAESPVSTFKPQTNIKPTINPTTPVQRPFRFSGISPAQPPPSVQRQSQSESIAVTSGTTFPPQAPPMWSPKTSAVVDSDPPASQRPSPSSTSAQPSATPQPPSPWRILSKERDTSQLPSSKSSPLPSSPWRGSSKARDSSQPPSPDRHQFQESSQAEVVQQPRSPSQLDFKSPQPSASPEKPLPPVSVKPNVAVSPPQSPEDQSKKKITSILTFKSPTKATLQPVDNLTKPPKRDIEMVENTSLVAQEPEERTRTVHFTQASGLSPNSKEKQLEDQHMVYKKEAKIPKATSFDEKQTHIKTSQPPDTKSTVSESRKKPVVSDKDRIPFQKELRNDIFMFAQKVAMAHSENSKAEQLASVVALVGKNEGAFMKLGSESPRGEGSFKNHGAKKTEPVEGTEDNERNKSAKRKRSGNENDQENQITKAFINNNVQDINNSILMNSFVTERNPGVHVALFYDPTEPVMSYDSKGSSEARKGKARLPLPKSLHMSPPSEGDT